jgi:enoyl-CoA hydratase/carnithine racemase
MTMENQLLAEKRDHIFHITLNRPEKRNAMPFEWLPEICALVEGQLTDPAVRCVMIRGAGPVFSAGVDFNSLGALVGRFMADHAAGGATIRADINQYQQYLNRLETIEIPIICAIHGRVFGMALELALACDIRLMSDDCLWSIPEARFGLVADLGGTARLSRTIGASRAMEALMTGRQYTADQAMAWGLVNAVHPEADLFSAADALAADIAKMAPMAVGAFKTIIKKGSDQDLASQLDMEVAMQSILLRTDDFQEGVAALMEGRAPVWKRK